MDPRKQDALDKLQKTYPSIESYVWHTLIGFGWTKPIAKLIEAIERSWTEIPASERNNVARIIYNS